MSRFLLSSSPEATILSNTTEHASGNQRPSQRRLSTQSAATEMGEWRPCTSSQTPLASCAKSQQRQNGQSQDQLSQKDIERKQAEDLLEEYQENEEPKKLLNYMPKRINDNPVLKDW